ncbi:hypothetical protein [Fervidibacillus halotolerans]|uniref:Uncharacterized protein n=1 Tax=Fervidibacillus halotolerans TaxID=2980027 RepID=A0A9E8LZJ9_9BACI|nr:hypothetical protein [Fervidibacillus halotolerans]WAA12595.1 hypothetical protein OE105_00120 [Fervidibacillus halotolerans]
MESRTFILITLKIFVIMLIVTKRFGTITKESLKKPILNMKSLFWGDNHD